VGIAYNTSIVRSGLVLHLDAANAKSYPGSGTTWTDLSGQGNNGTLVNGPVFNGNNVGSIEFDGVNDYVDCGNNSSLELSFPLTIEIWYYIYSSWTGTALGLVIKGPLSGDYDYMLYLTGFGTTLDFYKKNDAGSGANRAGFTTSYSHFNRWNHVCYTISTSGLANSYENGISRSESSFLNTEVRKSNQSLKIGQGWSSVFGGRISNLKIYNRALTSQEIQQNFEALRGRYGI
jgi:hypothetical protein